MNCVKKNMIFKQNSLSINSIKQTNVNRKIPSKYVYTKKRIYIYVYIYVYMIYVYIYIIDNIDKNTMDPMSANTTPRVLYSSQAAAGRRACGSCTGQSGR